MIKTRQKTCVLTIDVEEWFQVENLRAASPKKLWETKNSSVFGNTLKILSILKKHRVPATFFVLGWVAERNPELLKEIASRGHEIACHGFGHDLTYDLDEEKLMADIRRAKQALTSAADGEVVGYRAPNFSVDDRLLAILKQLGFRYDSSYNPFSLNKRYGSIRGKQVQLSSGCYRTENGIYELPISTLPVFGKPFPIGGGAYFRIFPLWVFEQLVRKKLNLDGYFNLYLHPWELEPEQPRMTSIKLNYRFRHYYGLKHTAAKLDKFLRFLEKQECRFLTMNQYLDQVLTGETVELGSLKYRTPDPIL
ncbi:MAG TPA: DUF3473 domain-containing protein [Caldithrix sp.]|nr:DUF3473 domain-containing protein [Caldithrix sp.]